MSHSSIDIMKHSADGDAKLAHISLLSVYGVRYIMHCIKILWGYVTAKVERVLNWQLGTRFYIKWIITIKLER